MYESVVEVVYGLYMGCSRGCIWVRSQGCIWVVYGSVVRVVYGLYMGL